MHFSSISVRTRSSVGRRRSSYFGNAAVGTVCLIAFWLSAAAAAIAQSPTPQTTPQTAQLLASYEGQNVTSVQFAGQPGLDISGLTPLLTQHAGEPFSKEKIDQTIASLERSGKVKQVRLELDPEGNGVRVLLILEPAFYFGIFEFTGADRFSYSQLVQVSDYPPEAPYNASDVQQDQERLASFFQREGYFQAAVQSEPSLDAAHRLANILFHVSLNRKAKFGEVVIAGTSSATAAKLTHDLRGPWARLRGTAIRPGKTYRLKTVTNATKYLQSRLAKEGWLAAKVQLAGAQYDASTNRAEIHFNVEEGPVTHVRIEGAHLWSWTRNSLLPIYEGVGVDPELVQEGRDALVSYFQGKGYLDAAVESQFQTQGAVDTITYKVVKKKKEKVTGIELSGNRQLTTSKLLPYLTVKKSHLFARGTYSERLVRSSTKNLTAAYQANGFSSVKVTSDVTKKDRNVQIRFRIDEGPQEIVQTLRIEGARQLTEAQFAPAGLKLAPGGPFTANSVQEDRKTVLARYLESGYLTASFRESAAPVSKQDAHHINVIYHIYEGPQIITAGRITLGRNFTQQRLIDRDIAAIEPEHPLTEGQLLTAESDLYSHTGVFDWAEVDPKRPITTQTQEDVLVKVHEAKRNAITYGGGFEVINRGGSVPGGTVALPNLPPVGLPSNFRTDQTTFYGPRGTFQYTRNNVGAKGESLSLTAFAGRLDQRGAAYYIDPNFLWSKWASTLTVSAEYNAENPIFSSEQELGSYQVQRELDKAKTRTFFLRYGLSQTNLTRVEIPSLVLPEDRNVRLSTIAASFTRDTRDNALDAHKGMLQSIEVDFNASKLGSSVNFAKLTAQNAYFKRIPGNIIWANDLRIGLAQPFANSRVPLSEEFFSGGGNTLRGFPLDGAGPQRQVPVCSAGSTTDCTLIQVPSGGHELLILNSEFRIPLPIKKNLGMVLFYDGGNVFPNVGFHEVASLYSNNVGIGLRYATPVGPIRVDLGRNLNPVPGIQATQYFISIGQAF